MTEIEKRNERRKVRVLELARMTTNEQSNVNQFFENVSETLRIFNEVFVKRGASEEFSKSVQNSILRYENPPFRNVAIAQLKPNSQDSFLIIPLASYGHQFAAVVRTFKGKANPYYSVVIANVGERMNHEKFEEYIFEDKGRLQGVLNQTNKMADDVNNIYELFAQNAQKKYLLKLGAKSQTIGNCYVKEIEKAMKFSTFPIEKYKVVRNRNKLFMMLAPKLRVKPLMGKKKIETLDFHMDFLEILKTENPDLKTQIGEIQDAYEFNKKFRNDLKRGKINFSDSELREKLQTLSIRTLTEILTKRKIRNHFKSMAKDNSTLMSLQKDIREKYMKYWKMAMHGHGESCVNLLNVSEQLLQEKAGYKSLNKQLVVELSYVLEVKAIRVKSKMAEGKLLEMAVRLDNSNSGLLYLLGQRKKHKECTEEAGKLIERALLINPGIAEILEQQKKKRENGKAENSIDSKTILKAVRLNNDMQKKSRDLLQSEI